MKFIKLLVLAHLVLTATTNFAFSQTTPTNQTTDSLNTATVKVKGISCSEDSEMISANVVKVKGVSSCKAGKQDPVTTFEVKYIPELVAEREIFVTIQNTGSCDNPDERPHKINSKSFVVQGIKNNLHHF